MEVWKDIEGFTGYQVSDQGRVRTFRKKDRDTPTIMSMSDDGNGYMKLMLYSDDNRRCCKKVHRLVAEAFIPRDPNCDTVDHIQSGHIGKLDNSVSNLRWVSRRENIQKAYRDGVCDERIRKQRKDIIVKDLWTGEEMYFSSIAEAAYNLGIDRTSISHVLRGDQERTNRYYFEYAGREERLLYAFDY